MRLKTICIEHSLVDTKVVKVFGCQKGVQEKNS